MPGNRFSIYDAMERAGRFSANPANPDARDKVTGASLYLGPVPYPKMMYHPEGEEVMTSPGEEVTRLGRQEIVGRQFELISRVVTNPADEEALRADGWHDHPAKAVRVRVEKTLEANPDLSEKERKKLLASIPPISSDTRIKDLEAELERITLERDQERAARDATANQPAAKPAVVVKPQSKPAAPPTSALSP